MSGARLIPFTRSPNSTFEALSHQHANLTAYIQRLAPEMRTNGQHNLLNELQRFERMMRARLRELESTGAAEEQS